MNACLHASKRTHKPHVSISMHICCHVKCESQPCKCMSLQISFTIRCHALFCELLMLLCRMLVFGWNGLLKESCMHGNVPIAKFA